MAHTLPILPMVSWRGARHPGSTHRAPAGTSCVAARLCQGPAQGPTHLHQHHCLGRVRTVTCESLLQALL